MLIVNKTNKKHVLCVDKNEICALCGHQFCLLLTNQCWISYLLLARLRHYDDDNGDEDQDDHDNEDDDDDIDPNYVLSKLYV